MKTKEYETKDEMGNQVNLEERRAKWREYYHKKHPRKEPKNFFHQKLQRIVTRDHYATRIFWNRDMLDLIKAAFPNTLNEDLAGMLGVSVRTMIRKARELGLQKDPCWLAAVWEERRLMAQVESKRLGYPGSFQKGIHYSPATEFKKGHVPANRKQNITS